MKKSKILRLSMIAMLSAVSFTLMFFEFPLIPATPYLKFDFSDLPAVIGAVTLGPWCGVWVELLKNILDLLVRGFGSQMGFGNLQNFLIGIAYVLPIALIYCKAEQNKNRMTAVLAFVVPVLSIITVGILSNAVVTPLFFRYFLKTELTAAEIQSYVLLTIPFNAVKGAVLSVLSAILFHWTLKPLRRIVNR